MQISVTGTGSTTLAPAPQAAQPFSLVVGQRLAGEVVGVFPDTETVQIAIPGGQLSARTTLNLIPGQALTLDVVESGALPVLKLVSTVVPDPVAAAVKTALPNQLDMKEFFGSLLTVGRADGEDSYSADALSGKARALIEHLPLLSALAEPSGLQKAILQSGLFLEANLARSVAAEVESDLKARLLRFIDDASGSHGESDTLSDSDFQALRGKAESVIAKLLMDQLGSLPNPEANRWLVDLPFCDEGKAGSLRVEIERQTTEEGEVGSDPWAVTLRLDPDELGSMQCRIAYRAGEVSSHFLCEREATASLVAGQLAELRERFQQAGIAPGSMSAAAGEPGRSTLPLVVSRLVDERA